MPLTVLTDDDVRRVLDRITKPDLMNIFQALGDGLHSYSTALDPQSSGCCSENQPTRISIKRPDGVSLFMPATTDDAFGVKTVTLSESKPSEFSLPLLTSSPTMSSTSSSIDSPRQGSSFSGASTISSTTQPPSDTIPDVKDPVDVLPLKPSATSPKGSLTLFSPDGRPRALINASTLTAFRTACASMLLMKLRKSVHTVTVFGAGLQALWHIVCLLILRGDEVHHIHVINRDFERAQSLMIELARSRNPVVQDVFLGGKMKPTILTPRHTEYARLLKEHIRASDVIMCCTPSTQPLFPAGHLTHTEGRRKARYIVAVGSYKPHMQELPEEVLRQAVAGPESSRHHGGIHLHHRHANEGGAIVVDSIDGAMTEAGEIIKSGIGGQGLVELGELVMLKRSHWAEKAKREAEEREKREREGKDKHHGGGHGLAHLFHHGKSEEKTPVPEDDGGLKEWLSRGNVIYKSVGIGLMDVVVGMEIVRLAEQQGIGTTVQNF